MVTDDAMEVLSESACWELLRTIEVGRLAVCLPDGPEIFPVNYAVDHGSLVFRTAAGTKLATVHDGARVAFEVDGYDAATNRAWSVVLRGTGNEVRTMADAAETADLPLSPWHSGAKRTFVRIVPEAVTGRRFQVTEADTWHTSFSELRRASED